MRKEEQQTTKTLKNVTLPGLSLEKIKNVRQRTLNNQIGGRLDALVENDPVLVGVAQLRLRHGQRVALAVHRGHDPVKVAHLALTFEPGRLYVLLGYLALESCRLEFLHLAAGQLRKELRAGLCTRTNTIYGS